jgi:F-type H+-transporting ATPase subunit b
LISIDFTALIILALVFALVVVLGRLFFEPLARAMEERQNRIDAAERIRAETARHVEEILGTHREAMNRARAESYQVLENARSAGQGEAERLFGAERGKIVERVERSREELRQQAAEALKSLESEAARLAGEIASRILGRRVA